MYKELERFNKLTDIMGKSLVMLRKALAGEVGMSNELDELSRALYNGTLPAVWRRFCPATLKSLGNWMLYHIDRFTQYHGWVNEHEPEVVFLHFIYHNAMFHIIPCIMKIEIYILSRV